MKRKSVSLLHPVKSVWSFIKNRCRRRPEESVYAPPTTGRIYLKALALRSSEDVERIKDEIKSGNIVIVSIGPLVEKSAEDAKRVINELSDFVASMKGDIARLGEERIILTPPGIHIWREKGS